MAFYYRSVEGEPVHPSKPGLERAALHNNQHNPAECCCPQLRWTNSNFDTEKSSR